MTSAMLVLRNRLAGLLKKISEMLLDVSTTSASKGDDWTEGIIGNGGHAEQQAHLFQTRGRRIIGHIELIVATA